jgi:NADH-quinone oxidoreductase subunit B
VAVKRLRDYGLKSERLLWPTKGPSVFEREVGVDGLEEKLMLTTLEKAVAWAQTKSMWPDQFGLSCCAMEMIAIVSSRYDIARFGMEAFRASPRQADLLIVSGRVAHKMAAPLRQIYDQMLEPKWVIAMGACASSGGMFNNYAVLQGVDKIVAVDIHVPGCPPRPEAVLHGLNKLQRLIRGHPDLGWRQRYNAVGTEEWARFEAGEPSPEAIERAALAVRESKDA